MPSFILYDDDGEIQSVMDISPSGYNVIQGTADDKTQYVDPETKEVADKGIIEPAMTADGLQLSISGIPSPCEVQVGAYMQVVEGGWATMSLPFAGEYRVVLKAPRFCRYETVIEVGS